MTDIEKAEEWIKTHRTEALQALGMYDFLTGDKLPKKKGDTVICDGKEYMLDDDPEYRLDDSGHYVYQAMAIDISVLEIYPTHIITWIVGEIGKPGHTSDLFNCPLNMCLWDKPDSIIYNR